MDPTFRVTNIALDANELPRELTVVMSPDVADELDSRFLLTKSQGTSRLDGLLTSVISIRLAANLVTTLGEVRGIDPGHAQTSVVWDRLDQLFLAFWDEGVSDYWSSDR